MQFKQGTDVFTTDGEKIGEVDRIVLDPSTDSVTHLVVEKGFFFKEDKVVPISLVGPTTEDKVTIRVDASDLERLPDFEEKHYVWKENGNDSRTQALQERALRTAYWYPPVGSRWLSSGYSTFPLRPFKKVRKEQNIPEDTVALKKGANVIGSDGKHIGDLERIFTDPLEDRATHFLISEGHILKDKKLIPTRWITNIRENRINLSVSSEFVNNLPDYEPRS